MQWTSPGEANWETQGELPSEILDYRIVCLLYVVLHHCLYVIVPLLPKYMTIIVISMDDSLFYTVDTENDWCGPEFPPQILLWLQVKTRAILIPKSCFKITLAHVMWHFTWIMIGLHRNEGVEWEGIEGHRSFSDTPQRISNKHRQWPHISLHRVSLSTVEPILKHKIQAKHSTECHLEEIQEIGGAHQYSALHTNLLICTFIVGQYWITQCCLFQRMLKMDDDPIHN